MWLSILGFTWNHVSCQLLRERNPLLGARTRWLADVSPSVADGAGFRVELCFLPAAVLASSPADLASMSRLPCDPATNAICCLDSLPVLTTMSSREVDDIVSI